MSYEKHILITGGAGFIGSHLTRYFVQKFPQYRIINADALTYAGNLQNLTDIEEEPNYTFVRADINDPEQISNLFEQHQITDVMHCAAESHVDRSILEPIQFVRTNVLGTANLLHIARTKWQDDLSNHLFYHISTDEVYGELGDTGYFLETTPYDPRSPYAASKASSDHFVRAYHHTYGMRTVISNCSNNYGPYQFPEKLVPLMIRNIVEQKPLPVYGKGENVRDWLYVLDHIRAMDLIFHEGIPGETYNIGGNNEYRNIDVVTTLCDLVDEALEREIGSSRSLITFVKDRAGHDHRYAIDATKIKNALGWEPGTTFEIGMKLTVEWYLTNQEWVNAVVSGEYQQYYEKQYALR